MAYTSSTPSYVDSTSSSVASVGTSYDVAKYHTLKFNPGTIITATDINFGLTSISTAATLTFRLSADAAGDKPLTEDTEASIAAGVTTSTVGAAVGVFARARLVVPSSGIVYVHMKTDAGTVTVPAVRICIEGA